MSKPEAVLCSIAAVSDIGNSVTGVDVGALIRRLVLFDKVIVKSVRLEELPPLIRVFGESGIRSLISAGALQFLCDWTSVGTDTSINGVRILPEFHFSFFVADLADPQGEQRKQFRVLQRVTGLKNHQRIAIEEAIWNSLSHYPSNFGQLLLDQLDNDLRTSSPALKAGIVHQLRSTHPEIDLSSYDFDLNIVEYEPRRFRIGTPFAKDLGLSPSKIHQILQSAVTSVECLNHRFSEMIEFSALTGFREDEAPILFGKVAGLISPQNPSIAEEQFKRVIEITDVPDFKPSHRVNADKLLETRDSDECRAFRDWLSKAGNLSDADITAMTHGIRSRLSSLSQSKGGKALRFMATTGLGLIPGAGLVLGPASSFVDSFLVDRTLKQPAVLAFLSDSYPSLFRSA
jgi:hypothetical protein